VHPRRISEQVSVAVPIIVDDRVLATIAVRFAATAVPLKLALERFLPKLKDTAVKIGQTFLAEQRDPPHQHHRPAQIR
jgi:hypothetical protein